MKQQTLFNLIARADLQGSFDRISNMLMAEANQDGQDKDPILVGASFSHRSDLGLQITLVRGSQGEMRHFCVTLMQTTAFPQNHAPVSALPTEFSFVNASEQGFGTFKEASHTPPQVDSTAFRIIG